MEYNDHSPNECTIPAFQNKFLKLKLQEILSAIILNSNNFLGEKHTSKKTQRRKTKPSPLGQIF